MLLLSCNCTLASTDGHIAAQVRYFPYSPRFDEQSRHAVSLSGEIEKNHPISSRHQLQLRAFGRTDSADSQRSHFDLREAYWLTTLESGSVSVGVQKVFWGVTESVHLVDIINQDDFVEDMDGEEKLGQPMVQLSWTNNWGSLQGYLLPYFRTREFPSESGRLRMPVSVISEPEYQSGAEERHLDWAVRWSNYFDIWDLAISHFSGTSRTPLLIPESGPPTPAVRPHYQQIEQTGVEVQATLDATLLKLEAISVYELDHGRNTAFVGGVEYTLYGLGSSNVDLGIISEYQFDDRTGVRQRLSQNDLAAGLRLSLNDFNATEVLALIATDLDNGNRFMSIEAERRLNNYWHLAVEARMFSSIDPTSPEFSFDRDDYLQMEIRRYF
ncbi:hypothetical protein HXX02_14800 [Microbulbifer elongatus]|uniref:Porin n=1 Tax=Microbulbifer elongatus TaxID=86173 RepID=A0ABT1P3L5_9GAMM|nr:hypothetical protein [Microbulbifer elongatus]MCQ3830706.1 hypothetical protein [Microbulbifer elongatus]